MIAPVPGLLPLATLVVLLVAVGWGLGMAAALARHSIGAGAPRQPRVLSPPLFCLAVLVALGALLGYALVLRALGLVPG